MHVDIVYNNARATVSLAQDADHRSRTSIATACGTSHPFGSMIDSCKLDGSLVDCACSQPRRTIPVTIKIFTLPYTVSLQK
jgi:hypothetical protein